MHTIELLAPAKDLECAIAAIDSGADAVYIGGPSFGARVNAGNSIEDIAKVCDYAHLFNAKVHVTLNTILTDEELKYAQEIIYMLYEAKVDALIIQDMGILSLDLPPIELHASTQQDNRSADKVKFLEELGFNQVVLARELSLNDIKAIKAKTNIKLEAFIHGALCVGISGRCYLSQALTNRSANRGECAQLCRLEQSLYDANGNALAKNKYLLSLKDLNQSNNLEELIDAGISSFKIEGRLKDINYVRNVTAYYRKKIDAIIAKRTDIKRTSFGVTTTTFTPNPEKSFNRGFTEYNTHEIKDNYANFLAPGFVGSPIGTLISNDTHSLTLELNKDIELHNGDSLNYYQPNGTLDGFRISVANGNKAEIFQVLPTIKKGTVFYRNKDAQFEKELQGKKPVTRKLGLTLSYSEEDNAVILTGTDETDTTYKVRKEIIPQKASSTDKLTTTLKDKFARLGDSVYELKKLNLELPFEHFVPVSIINELRREVIAGLNKTKQDIKRTQKPGINIESSLPIPKSEQNLGFKTNIFNKKAFEFYQKHGISNPVMAYEYDKGNEPREVLVSKHCLRYCFNLCPKYHNAKAQDLYLAIGNKYFKLKFNCVRCEMSLIGPLNEKPF